MSLQYTLEAHCDLSTIYSLRSKISVGDLVQTLDNTSLIPVCLLQDNK
jgi:hypothetical protein